MALNEAMVWEMRSTGTYNGGSGWYDLVPGESVDYSQQDNPQATITDITTGAAGVTIGSVSSAFTSAMAGNCMFVTGNGVTSGWYAIISVPSYDQVIVDRTIGAGLTSVTGYVGGAFNPAVSAVRNLLYNKNKVSNNQMWIKSGTYDMTVITDTTYSIISLYYNRVSGYKTVRGDEVSGDDRPFFSLASASNCKSIIFLGSYQAYYGLRFESLLTSGGDNLTAFWGSNITLFNCKGLRAGYNGANCFAGNFQTYFVACEGIASSGTAFALNSTGCVEHCYSHDSKVGINAGNRSIVNGNIIENCISSAILIGYGNIVENNTIYNCGAAFNLYNTFNIVYNNIVKDCTSLITGSDYGFYLIDFNNCAEGYTNGYTNNNPKGHGSITSDPLLANPASHDFSLLSSSPCFNAALAVNSNVGVITV
jgi:hypothetical protein